MLQIDISTVELIAGLIITIGDLDEIKETQVVMLGSMFVMLQHMATGNNTGEMNGELKKLTEFLAQK